MSTDSEERKSAPLRIGVWCDYGFTLTPTAGIGVFVYNLVAGLLDLTGENLEIVMLVRPGDEHLVENLKKKSQGRLTNTSQLIVSDRSRPVEPPETTNSSTESAKSYSVLMAALAARSFSIIRSLRCFVVDRGAMVVQRHKGSRLVSAFVFSIVVLFGPIAAVAGWFVYSSCCLLISCLRVLSFPLRALHKILRADQASVKEHSDAIESEEKLDHDPVALARLAACDVWLIPYCGFNYPLHFPSVLAIHDLVYLHFPEAMPQDAVSALRTVVPQRAAEATLCACMSAFIEENDLLGSLGLPRDKVRMIRFAAPTDFPEMSDSELEKLQPKSLNRPYLFFPAEFRPYKNQRILVEALHELQLRGEDRLDVVFTGGNDEIPEYISSLIEQYRIENKVHVLGRVDRRTLAALYRYAYATVVPSLYEQGSFPIYEALRWNCPVLCSRIPPLLDQCSPMGDAMLYFDPLDPESLADAVSIVLEERSIVVERQRRAADSLWNRTWRDAATEWLDVFREAATLSALPQSHGSPTVVSEPLEVMLFSSRQEEDPWSLFMVDALKELVIVNRQVGKLRLTLGVPQGVSNEPYIRELGGDITVHETKLGPASRYDMEAVYSHDAYHEDVFSFFQIGSEIAKNADGWVALSNNFAQPLLPVRPYGLVEFDVFESTFSPNWKKGILPTLKRADIAVVHPETARILLALDIDEKQIRMLPLTWDCAKLFGTPKTPSTRHATRRFILSVTKGASYSGLSLLLQGYAYLKNMGTGDNPQLLVCGYGTELFSDEHKSDTPYAMRIRRLVDDLGLRNGVDVKFLGAVSMSELSDLYGHCSVAVNTGKYDFGLLSLVGAAYCGKHTISIRYPGADYIRARFNIPISFLSLEDPKHLGTLISEALSHPEPCSRGIDLVRETLARPEFRMRRFAEGLYDFAIAIAERGRIERNRRLRNSLEVSAN